MVNVNGEDRVIIIHKILHVPRLGTNLFSIGTATENGIEAVFIDNQVFFFRNGKVEITGKHAGRTLYHLNIRSHINERDAAYSATKGTSMAVWHQRLAHVNTKTIRRLFTQGIVDRLDLHQTPEEKSSPCWGCAEGKMHRTSFKEGRNRATRLGELIHSDVCGPMSTPTLAGSNYYVTFKDDFSDWVVVNFMKKKSEVPQLFRQFAAALRNGYTAREECTIHSRAKRSRRKRKQNTHGSSQMQTSREQATTFPMERSSSIRNLHSE